MKASQETTTVGKLQQGELYVTGPAEDLFVKLDECKSRDVIEERELEHAGCRQCRRPGPRDFRRAAKRLADFRLFAVKPTAVSV
jgi:hypothetical protein